MSKLDWMYKSSNSIDPEDYLLGKAIDKSFEAQGSSRNEVDKDILPTSIFATSNSSAPVDIFRKIKEDPLEQIKQKEIEMRKQLLKNPVKMKKLQSMLRAKAEKKEQKKKKKKSKSKDIDDRLSKLLQKYGAKKVMELTKSDGSEEEEDGKFMGSSRMGKRIEYISDSSSDKNRNDSKDRDGRGRKSSRERSSKYEGKKKKIKRRTSSGSSGDHGKTRKNISSDRRLKRDDRGHRRNRSVSSDDTPDSRNRKGKSSKDKPEAQGSMNEYMRMIEKHGTKKLMELISDDSEEENFTKKKKKFKVRSHDLPPSDGESDSRVRKYDRRKKQSASSIKGKNRQRSSSEYSSSDHEKISKKGGIVKSNLDVPTTISSGKHKQRSSSSSSYSPDGTGGELEDKIQSGSRRGYSSDEEKSSFKKAYGLVIPKGVEAKPKSLSRPATDSSSNKVEDQKSKFVRPKPSRLTEEEKEAKLKEMMANAQWRDKERKSKVAKYREEEKREADNQKYDEGFMRKELAKAVDSSKSVEERIKSRMNNLQRSKFSMSQNFARRY